MMVQITSILVFAAAMLISFVSAAPMKDMLARRAYSPVNHYQALTRPQRHAITTSIKLTTTSTKKTTTAIKPTTSFIMPTTFSIKYVTTSIEPTTTSIKLATSTTTIIATTSTNSAAPESTKTPSAPADWCTEMLSQVNAIRAKAGKAALVLDDRMVLMAQKQSDYQFQIKKMTHDNVSGALTQRCTQVGVKWWGVAENVAAGQKDVTSVVTACKNSAGHYTNIIGNYNIVGFAINGIYWTQTFALI